MLIKVHQRISRGSELESDKQPLNTAEISKMSTEFIFQRNAEVVRNH